MTLNTYTSNFAPPLVVASSHALREAGLPGEAHRFLGTVGLPSNALWFDRSCSRIMCFDGVASLRLLSQTDVSGKTWHKIVGLGDLRVLGTFGQLFIVIDKSARMWLIDSTDGSRMKESLGSVNNADWRAAYFLNDSPGQFASCLMAYKEMRDVFEREAYDFSRAAIRNALATCRRAMEAADKQAFSAPEHYWTEMMERVEG